MNINELVRYILIIIFAVISSLSFCFSYIYIDKMVNIRASNKVAVIESVKLKEDNKYYIKVDKEKEDLKYVNEFISVLTPEEVKKGDSVNYYKSGKEIYLLGREIEDVKNETNKK